MPRVCPTIASNSDAASALSGSAASAAANNSIALLPAGLKICPASSANRASASKSPASTVSTSNGASSRITSDSANEGVAEFCSIDTGVSGPLMNQKSAPATITTAVAAMPINFGLRSRNPSGHEPPNPGMSEGRLRIGFTTGGLLVGAGNSGAGESCLSDEKRLVTVLISPVSVSVKLESSWPNASANPSSIGEFPAGLVTEPSGGSTGVLGAVSTGLVFAVGFAAGFGAAFARAGLGAGGRGAGLAVAGAAAAPLLMNAASGASR